MHQSATVTRTVAVGAGMASGEDTLIHATVPSSESGQSGRAPSSTLRTCPHPDPTLPEATVRNTVVRFAPQHAGLMHQSATVFGTLCCLMHHARVVDCALARNPLGMGC